MKVMLNIKKKMKKEKKKIVVDGSLIDIIDLQNLTAPFWKNRSKG